MDKARIETEQNLKTSVDLSLIPADMPSRKSSFKFGLIFRPIADALVALTAFVLICLSVGTQPSSANPSPVQFNVPHETVKSFALKAVGEAGSRPIIEIATTSSPANADAVFRRTSATAAWTLLALAFSGIVAFNLAVLRHLRQAYAGQRNR